MTFPSFTTARVLVVGDLMLDQYWYGDASRLSPEAPVPVVKVDQTDQAAGGAGNVALNLAALGVQTSLYGVVGADAQGQQLVRLLNDNHVQCYLQMTHEAPTIQKLRLLGRNQQLVRADFEKTYPESTYEKLYKELLQVLPQFDSVLISDYGKGIQQIIPPIIQRAREASIPVYVDPKFVDFSCYEGATLITPNRQEFETVVGQCPSKQSLETQALNLIESHNLEGLLITQGGDGMTLFIRGEPSLHLPTRAQEVFDVTGAGDTVIAVLTAARAAHKDWAQAAQLANIAAGHVVAKLGTATVTASELRRDLQENYDTTFGVIDINALQTAVKEAKARGEKVVMTNGCFDLLHAGHIQYLMQAKQLGDRLIVAVNDDASVKRLKGQHRPVKPLTERMAILSALRAVDWVVSFSEDTPKNLIECLTPDVLVKGGDYQVDSIAGAQHVKAHGGEVRLLSYYSDYSTSKTIQTIQELD